MNGGNSMFRHDFTSNNSIVDPQKTDLQTRNPIRTVTSLSWLTFNFRAGRKWCEMFFFSARYHRSSTLNFRVLSLLTEKLSRKSWRFNVYDKIWKIPISFLRFLKAFWWLSQAPFVRGSINHYVMSSRKCVKNGSFFHLLPPSDNCLGRKIWRRHALWSMIK